jgi:hypothetical protein
MKITTLALPWSPDGREARKAYFETWVRQQGARLPEMLGVIEAKLR